VNRQQSAIWLCIGIGFCLYAASFLHQQSASIHPFHTGGLPPTAQQLMAGPYAGVAADLNILGVFAIYDSIVKQQEQNGVLWHHLHNRLQAAQMLDPKFWDTYRLTTGLMGFHQQGAAAAVDLLSKGAEARDWDWEMPFIAAYLSHDMLHDDRRAYQLMNMALKRPNAPPLAIGLAAEFLKTTEGNQASLRFLTYLRKSLPPRYRDVIDARIKKLAEPVHNGGAQ
jgi:hypothetical protein